MGDENSERNTVSTQKPGDFKGRWRFKWDASEDTLGDEDDYRRRLRLKSQRSAFGRAIPFSRPSNKFDFDERRARKIDAKRVRPTYDQRRWSEKKRDEMTERDWRIFREDYLISFRGGRVTNPARSWDECGLSPALLKAVTAQYTSPTPIQMATIPVCVEGHDVIGLAETGSGKTAAYVLPMLWHISKLPPLTGERARYGAYALVLAPTRELASQIDAETRRFAVPLGMRVVTVIGGADMQHQADELQRGAEIIICTPGRMVDLIDRRLAALANCNFLVLDEADRMIDMGFEPKVQQILAAMPEQAPTDSDRSRRQTLMFSATMVPAVERLARTYLVTPIIVTIGETGQAADNVEQRVEYFAHDGRRRNRLVELLNSCAPPILVFCNTRSTCEVVSRFVEPACVARIAVMHAGKNQDTREYVLDAFRNGRIDVLIATDVVGRGIDVKGVQHVINYELPDDVDKYTHRIGRTGRAGRRGTAISIATPNDAPLFPALRRVLERAGAKVPPEIARADGNAAPGSNRAYKNIVD